MNAMFHLTEQSVLELEGKDRVDLLHRLASNALQPLAAPGTVRQTLFTTNQGRLIDWVWLAARPEALLALASPGRAARLVAWVEGYTIMEDVRTRDASARWAHCLVLGDEARRALALPPPSAPDRLVEHLEAQWIMRPSAFGAWLDALVPSERLDVFTAELVRRGLRPATERDVTLARLSAGVPDAAAEFSEEVNPLELRLGAHAVSFTKGCYIGQEVIARLDSYDKVARLLVGFEGPATGATALASASPEAGAPIAKLVHAGHPLGRVTSMLERSDGSVLGLAVVKRELAVAGTQAVLQTAGGERPVQLVDRPFWAGAS